MGEHRSTICKCQQKRNLLRLLNMLGIFFKSLFGQKISIHLCLVFDFICIYYIESEYTEEHKNEQMQA